MTRNGTLTMRLILILLLLPGGAFGQAIHNEITPVMPVDRNGNPLPNGSASSPTNTTPTPTPSTPIGTPVQIGTTPTLVIAAGTKRAWNYQMQGSAAVTACASWISTTPSVPTGSPPTCAVGQLVSVGTTASSNPLTVQSTALYMTATGTGLVAAPEVMP